jgi:hypothetical protein
MDACEKLRMTHCLDSRLTDGSKVVSPRHRPRSTTQKHYYILVNYIYGSNLIGLWKKLKGERIRVQFSPEPFVFTSPAYKHKDYNIWIYSFARGFVCLWNLVSEIKGGTQTEGVWEKGAEENILTQKVLSGRSLETSG